LFSSKKDNTYIIKNFKSERWCCSLINVCYAITAVNLLTHLAWFIFAGDALITPPDIYVRDYIILSTLSMLVGTKIALAVIGLH